MNAINHDRIGGNVNPDTGFPNSEGLRPGPLPGVIAAGPGSPAPNPIHFDLDAAQSQALAQFITDDAHAGVEVRLTIAVGHSGLGLYAFQTDYPDEGAIFVAPLVIHAEADA
jgi:hypothetical protein